MRSFCWLFKVRSFLITRPISLLDRVVSPHHLVDPNADPDPAYHFDADPDPDFYLMRIRMLNRILVLFDADVNRDPTFHFDADPDVDLAFCVDLDPAKVVI